jgi:hypothetical protein
VPLPAPGSQAGLNLDLHTAPDAVRWEIAANLMVFELVVDGNILHALPGRRDVRVLIGTNADEQRFLMVPTAAISHVGDAILARLRQLTGLAKARCRTNRSHHPQAYGTDILAALSGDRFSASRPCSSLRPATDHPPGSTSSRGPRQYSTEARRLPRPGYGIRPRHPAVRGRLLVAGFRATAGSG